MPSSSKSPATMPRALAGTGYVTTLANAPTPSLNSRATLAAPPPAM